MAILRDRQDISVPLCGVLWGDRIVPLAMECIPLDVEGPHFAVGDFYAFRIDVGVDPALNPKAFLCCRRGDQVDDDFMAHERFAAPILADERKQAMFDFVPLARAGREMTDRDGQPCFVGQFLKFPFPQPDAIPVAAAAVGRDQQALGLGIPLAPHRMPPATDALDREGRGVMVDPDADPSGVFRHIVHTVRRGTP